MVCSFLGRIWKKDKKILTFRSEDLNPRFELSCEVRSLRSKQASKRDRTLTHNLVERQISKLVILSPELFINWLDHIVKRSKKDLPVQGLLRHQLLHLTRPRPSICWNQFWANVVFSHLWPAVSSRDLLRLSSLMQIQSHVVPQRI